MRRSTPLVFIILCMCIIFPNPAFAEPDSIILPGFATIEYPTVVKIAKTKCQKVNLDYQIDENLDINGAAIAIQIGNVKKKTLNGGTAWFGLVPGSENVGPLPSIGRLTIKVCKNNWTFKTQKYIAIKAQTYDFYFGYGWYFSDGTSSKATEIRKIKFVK